MTRHKERWKGEISHLGSPPHFTFGALSPSSDGVRGQTNMFETPQGYPLTDGNTCKWFPEPQNVETPRTKKTHQNLGGSDPRSYHLRSDNDMSIYLLGKFSLSRAGCARVIVMRLRRDDSEADRRWSCDLVLFDERQPRFTNGGFSIRSMYFYLYKSLF